MQRITVLCAMALLLGLVACDQRGTPLAPEPEVLRFADDNPSNVIMYMPDPDNVACWGSADGFWFCVHENHDYGSPWSNPIKNYCTLYPETCTFIDEGFGGGVANPVYPMDTPENSDQGFGYDSLPTTCPSTVQGVRAAYPDSTSRASLAWCLGTDLDGNTAYKSTVTNALSRLRAKGGVCATLANLGDTLVAHDRIRTFVHNSPTAGLAGIASYIGGATAAVGGPLSKYSFLSISERLPKFAFDSEHPDLNSAINLESVLAHELAHLLGQDHITVLNGVYRNEMELACI